MLTTIPFHPAECVDQAGTTDGHAALNLDHMLGRRFELDLNDGYGLREFMLVELNVATPTFDVRGKAFKWDDDSTFKVAPCAGTSDRIVGVGYYVAASEQGFVRSSIPDTAYFLVQTRGRCRAVHADDVAGDPGAADDTNIWIAGDDDADLGKVNGRTTFAEGITFARFVSGAAADDAIIVIDLQITR